MDMTSRAIIESALATGQTALSESQSKELLAAYGVPLSREMVALDAGRAIAAAKEIGFPVALKADAPGITHKTEAGLVALNLTNADNVKRAAARLLNAAPAGSGLLVQEMIQGEREFMLGMKRDAQYGPCINFGLGGIFAEALEDVALRLAPLSNADALSMLTDIRAAQILGPYRGMAPVNCDTLAAALTGLGQCAIDHPEIADIDVNPMIVNDAGLPLAVDALVVLLPSGA